MSKNFEKMRRATEELDYINCNKYSNSVIKALKNKPNGFTFKEIARLMCIPETHIRKVYKIIIKKLRKGL